MVILVACDCSAALKGTKLDDVLGFAPDGEHAVLRTERPSIQLVELASGRVLWEKPYPDAPPSTAGVVSHSADGALFVMAAERRHYGPGRYTLWNASSGALMPVAGHPEGLEVASILAASPPSGLALSDDGRFIASALEGGIRLYDRTSGRALYQDVRGAGDTLGFQRGRHALAAQMGNEKVNRTVVVVEDAGQWKEAATFPGAFFHAWAGTFLAVSAPEGLIAWDGHASRTVAAWNGKPRRLFAPARAEGLVVAATTTVNEATPDDGADLFDLALGKLVFSKPGIGKVWGAEMRDGVLVLGIERAKFQCFAVELEPRTGVVRKEKALGARENVASWTVPEAARQQTVFVPALLPGGKYVDLRSDSHHRVVRISD